MAKMFAPVGNIIITPVDAVAGIKDLLKVSHYTTGGKALDLTSELARGSGVKHRETEKATYQRMTSTVKAEVPIAFSFEAELILLVDAIKPGETTVNNTTVAGKAQALFEGDFIGPNMREFYITKRRGFPASTPMAAGQKVSVYKVALESVNDEEDSGTMVQRIGFLPGDAYLLDEALTA